MTTQMSLSDIQKAIPALATGKPRPPGRCEGEVWGVTYSQKERELWLTQEAEKDELKKQKPKK